MHWPEYTVRSMGAAAAKANAVVDQLARDREATATQTINTFGELLLPHVPAPYRAILQQLWTRFGPIAVERVTVQAASVTVVDERGPGSTVEFSDERD